MLPEGEISIKLASNYLGMKLRELLGLVGEGLAVDQMPMENIHLIHGHNILKIEI